MGLFVAPSRPRPGTPGLLDPSAAAADPLQGLLGGSPQAAAAGDVLMRWLSALGEASGPGADAATPARPSGPQTMASRAPATRSGGAPADPLVCHGVGLYSAVGPHQGTAGGALTPYGVTPDSGTVAVGDPERTFGLTKRQLAKIAPHIVIQPQGLDAELKADGGPATPLSVGDIGDKSIRDSPTPAFDIYGFDTLQGARQFGRKRALTTITIPQAPGVRCPPLFVQTGGTPPGRR